MTVTQSNDEKLKEVLLNNSKVIVFYYKKDSELCKQLLEDFIKLSLNDSYRALTFVTIDIENSISAERLSKQIPIVSCYHNGLLIECKSILKKVELVSMLNELKKEKINN